MGKFDKCVIIIKHFQHLKETPHPEWELCLANTSRTKLKKKERTNLDVYILEATSVLYRPDALINVLQKLLGVHTEGVSMEYFIDINLLATLWVLGLTQLLTEMSTRNISWWVKAVGA